MPTVMESPASKERRAGFNLVNQFIFPTPRSSYDCNTFASHDELIWLPRSLTPEDPDPSLHVPCIFLTSPSARFVMIYLHSNAEDLGRCYHFCSMIRLQFQVNVLAVEYPGYGLCPGEADADSVIANALLGYRFITATLQVSPEDIIIVGRSVGSGPALYLAGEFPVFGIILVAPFLSVKEVVRNHLGRVADLIEERFPNLERVKRIKAAMLIVHGKQDGIVPWTQGEALYEACCRRKRLVTPCSLGHNANLLTDPSVFVVPALHFFGLPDYNFESLSVPSWVFDYSREQKRRIHGHAASRAEGLAQPARPGLEDSDERPGPRLGLPVPPVLKQADLPAIDDEPLDDAVQSCQLEDDLPSPPDDTGFFKAPHSQNSGPMLLAPLPPQTKAAEVSCECGPSWTPSLCRVGGTGRITQEFITVGQQPALGNEELGRPLAGTPDRPHPVPG